MRRPDVRTDGRRCDAPKIGFEATHAPARSEVLRNLAKLVAKCAPPKVRRDVDAGEAFIIAVARKSVAGKTPMTR